MWCCYSSPPVEKDAKEAKQQQGIEAELSAKFEGKKRVEVDVDSKKFFGEK